MLQTVVDVMGEERMVSEWVAARCDGEGVERGGERGEVIDLVQ